MKRKNLVLLTSLLLTQTAPVWGMWQPDLDTDKRRKPSHAQYLTMAEKLQVIGVSYKIENKWYRDQGKPSSLDAESDADTQRVFRSSYHNDNTSWYLSLMSDGKSYKIENKWHRDQEKPSSLDAESDACNQRVYRSNYHNENTSWYITPMLDGKSYKIENKWHRDQEKPSSLTADISSNSGRVYRSSRHDDTTFWYLTPMYLKPFYYKLITDPYNVKADFNAFIKKLKIDDKFYIHNRSQVGIELFVKFENKNKGRNKRFETKEVSIRPYHNLVIDLNTQFLLECKIKNERLGEYLNPQFTENGILKIIIDNNQDKKFLHQKKEFYFSSKEFTESELLNSWPTEEKNFRMQFNYYARNIDAMMKEHGSCLDEVCKQRNKLYAKNNISSLLQKDPGLLDSSKKKIPLITHKIWLTADDNPKDPDPNYIKWLENSIEHNKEGWTHYFWIHNKKNLPNLVKRLENHPNITLKEVEGTSSFITGNRYKDEIRNKKYGKASDIVRLELLRRYGGFYMDTDYELFHSLKPYSKAYDMVIGMEPLSPFLCNAFIGAKKEHPVIIKALEMIKINFSDNRPNYIKNCTDNSFETILQTGPGLMTAAFALAGGAENYVDIVFPPQILCPAITNQYPERRIPKPGEKVPAEAIGAHYWEGTWVPGSEFDAK